LGSKAVEGKTVFFNVKEKHQQTRLGRSEVLSRAQVEVREAEAEVKSGIRIQTQVMSNGTRDSRSLNFLNH
jgi:hypothetical protein